MVSHRTVPQRNATHRSALYPAAIEQSLVDADHPSPARLGVSAAQLCPRVGDIPASRSSPALWETFFFLLALAPVLFHHCTFGKACKLANYATPPVSPLGYRALEPPLNAQFKGRLGGMDNERRQRQNPSGYANQQGTLLPPQAQYPVVSAPDRYRQAPLSAPAAPPTSAPATASRASYGYAYGEGAQFGSTIPPAGVSYGTQDYGSEQSPAQAQRAPQPYSPYGQNIMYSVPSVAGAQGSAPGSSQYEPVEQYQQNRDSAIQVLTTGFGVAQPQYYEQNGPTSTPASASIPSQYPSLGYTAAQAQVGREALAPAYAPTGMANAHQDSAQGTYAQGYSEPSQSSGNEYDDFYNNYQTELKKTFEHVRDSRLSEAGAQLYRLSDWLLHWAETLGKSSCDRHTERAAELTTGLVRDDETHYQQRLKLWEEFNTCWLATLQKQKTMTQEMINTGHRPQPPKTLIDYDFLEKMGTQLVKNCDNMEKHGLVDYQMGVWEEEIVASEYSFFFT